MFNQGVIPRSVHDIFNSLENSPEKDYSVKVSFLELYNEELSDLLSNEGKEELKIFEDVSGGKKNAQLVVQGLEELDVTSAVEVFELLQLSQSRRRKSIYLFLSLSISFSLHYFKTRIHNHHLLLL